MRIQTSEKVFRIDDTAITSGSRTAGSVPKTKKRMISAPRPPISASTRTLGPAVSPLSFASMIGSRPVTCTVVSGGRPVDAAFSIASAPLFLSNCGKPAG